jgi:hypothetical protein
MSKTNAENIPVILQNKGSEKKLKLMGKKLSGKGVLLLSIRCYIWRKG